ncbi:MAG: serine/threonine protein kinase [Acidobacteria bacterium]|nr:serine/threonine protein kinase [Acidobacteriota bacterium]
MAHYDGQTLKERLDAGPLPVDDALEIAAQVAEGLAKAHAQGVIHRDIKPGNLILTEDGVKILDFGLAKLAAESLRLTLEGTTIGTVAYMSPEQARGDEADPRADIWALGIVLYEMLAGEPPFRGHYAEAISHAIRHDTPAPLRTLDRDIPEALECLVFRALQKNPEQRIQTARELARELRLLQGRTLPLDLRTEPLTSIPSPPQLDAARGRRFWTLRTAMGVAAAAVAVSVGASLWVFAPVERIQVAVAPVMNQTGYPELDAYRLALTEELTGALTESHSVRVMPYERLAQVLRRFRAPGQDVSSREAIQALTAATGAPVVIIPTLVYENSALRARIEVRDSATATNRATYDTAPIVSSLIKDSAYRLVPALAAGIESHFLAVGPRRAAIADTVRRLTGREPPAPAMRLGSLDAAAALEQGLDAYEQQEYSAALRSFVAAAARDPRSGLLFAWQSRVARLMRREKEAAEAAAQAVRLLTEQTPPQDRLFVEAVAAESRRDVATAEARYRELAARHSDEPAWTIELAAFLDRQLRFADAAESYHRALNLDPRLARPNLELCRLYGPLRLNDTPRARQHGDTALERYRMLGSTAGEAQTLWCLADALVLGSDQQKAEAAHHVDAAARTFETLHQDYNLSRAYNYDAIVAYRQGRLADAAALWERSLAAAKTAGNVGLEAAVLTNLGSTYSNLGNPARAIELFPQGYALFEAMGEEQQAAQNQADGAALVVAYGGDLDKAFRDLQNALAVFQKLGNKDYEEFTLRALGTYHREAGRRPEAELELNRARAIAAERNFADRIATSAIDLARSRFDDGDYAGALMRLTEALGDGSGAGSAESRIRLARTRARLGDFDAADADLRQIDRGRLSGDSAPLLPMLDLVRGELAYESGQLREARTRFAAASAVWTDTVTLPEEASVEARAYLGLIDALGGRTARGVVDIGSSLRQARTMGRFTLEHRCRLLLARLAIAGGRFEGGLRILDEIPADDASRSIGRELRAQVHYWRGRALAGLGRAPDAAAESAQARTLVDQVRASLPERYRDLFAARLDIRVLGQ